MTDAKSPSRKIEASEYLGTAFEPSDRLAILIRNRQRGETVQRITTAGIILEPSFQDWLHFKNDREGFDVYVGMNPLKPAARTRTKEDILSIRHLYVDLDHDGTTSLAAIQQSPFAGVPARREPCYCAAANFRAEPLKERQWRPTLSKSGGR